MATRISADAEKPVRIAPSNTKSKIALAAAAVVILASIGWVVYLATAGGPSYQTEVVPVAEFRRSLAPQMHDNEVLFERVVMIDGEDRKSMTVSGAVRNEGDLQKLKAIFDAGTPKIPVQFNVVVKPAGQPVN